MTKRKCKHCKTLKELKLFESYNRNYGIAHRVICKDCQLILNSTNTFTCQVCKKDKNRKEFPNSLTSIVGIEHTCKKCKRKMFIASGMPQIISRDRRGRYKSDPEFRERLKAHSKKQRLNFKERIMLGQARIRARKKDMGFNITVEDIVIPKICPILEIPIITTNTKRLWNSASLDRVDNSKGYIKGNVRVISYLANHLKGIASFKELETFSKNILPYLKGMI